tara:strand:- start:3608 stop:3838 length:231 start_codon:yes stop_codon:yes gene_type:complete
MKYIKKFKLNESRDSIVQALKDNGGELENGELLNKSGYDTSDTDNIMDFYTDLSSLVKNGIIEETSDKTRMRLILK